MVMRLPTRINRCLRTFATLVAGFGTIYVVVNILHGTDVSTGLWSGPKDGSVAPSTQACVPRFGQGIAGNNRFLRPHLPLDRPHSPFPRLEDAPSLPLRCLDEWLGHGSLSCDGTSAGSELKMDVVWTWVNGSDPKWREVKRLASQEEAIFSPGFHFRCARPIDTVCPRAYGMIRDQDELRYSVRSVMEAIPNIISTGHIIVADFPFNQTTDEHLVTPEFAAMLPNDSGPIRLAQVPHWLDFTTVGCSSRQGPTIQLVTHSDIFHLPSDGSPGEADTEHRWRQNALPSFNSKAIESRIGWVPGLVR